MIARNPITTLKGHFDGKRIVLDEPPPADLEPNTPVQVSFQTAPAAPEDGESLFARLLEMSVDSDKLPPDFSAQHEHYTKGAPRR